MQRRLRLRDSLQPETSDDGAPVSVFAPWTETVLYRFTGGLSDGACPSGNLIFGQAGSLYRTTHYGGASRAGTI